jgi:hypothetical protein
MVDKNECKLQQFSSVLNENNRENQKELRAMTATYIDWAAAYICHTAMRICDNTRGLLIREKKRKPHILNSLSAVFQISLICDAIMIS